MEGFYIGMDIGGTTFKALAVSCEGRILDRVQDRTGAEPVPEVVVCSIVEALRSLQARVSSSSRQLEAIGFGIAGVVDLPAGIVRRSPNLPRWRDFDLRRALHQHLDMPFSIENDANAAALGEAWLGAGRDMDDFLMLTMGTGVGGGVMVAGNLVHGAHGYAGEPGHTAVDPNGPACGCGSQGCLEQYVSGTAIARMAEPYYGKATARDVAQAAWRGEAHALAIYQNVGRYLGIACANFANLLSPQGLIIGGAVAQAFDLFRETMYTTMHQRTFPEIYTRTRVLQATCGTDAGSLGAAYQAMRFGGA
ncbi:Glucokinase [Candidatus Entotheonellaceae bacterium PAL068K]